MHYNEVDYLEKLSSLNNLLLEYKFILSDLLLFHKLIYKQIPVRIPKEITNLSKKAGQMPMYLTNTKLVVIYKLERMSYVTHILSR